MGAVVCLQGLIIFSRWHFGQPAAIYWEFWQLGKVRGVEWWGGGAEVLALCFASPPPIWSKQWVPWIIALFWNMGLCPKTDLQWPNRQGGCYKNEEFLGSIWERKREWTFTAFFFFWFSGAVQIKTSYNTFKRKMSLAQSQVLEKSPCAVQYVCTNFFLLNVCL